MDLEAWLKEQESGAGQGWPLSLDGVRHAAEIIWATPQFRDYTDHSVAHSLRIIEHLGKLAGDLVLSKGINATEVYVLLASAYLHDIGMQYERFQGGDLGQIRRHHHELTRQIIMDVCLVCGGNRHQLGLEQAPPRIVKAIAIVAEGHRGTDLRDPRYKEFTLGNARVRPQLLTALLRLADGLDIDYRRVHLELLSLRDISVESEFHWLLCYYVSGVDIQDGHIGIDYQFPVDCLEYYRIVDPLVRGRIASEFDSLQEILWRGGCKVHLSARSEVDLVERLSPMPPDVYAFALKRSREQHMREIARHREEVRFCESMSQAVIGDAQSEVL